MLISARHRVKTARKSQAARKTAEMLVWPKMAGAFLHLYDELHQLVEGINVGRNRLNPVYQSQTKPEDVQIQ